MKVELLHFSGFDAAYAAAGICRNSKNPEDAFYRAVEAGHTSLLEHIVFSFFIDGITRNCSHQLVRHRIGFSFSQQSQRHVKVAEGYDWYIPAATATKEFHGAVEVARQSYLAAIEAGIPLEDARDILPGCTKTSLVLTANARALEHFFHLRLCRRAQKPIRELAHEMFGICYQKAPKVFDGPYPDCSVCKDPCSSRQE